MIKMLRQVEILAAVTKLLATKYSYPVYSDEVVEDFATPCFFIKLVKAKDNETVNTTGNNLSIIITFFPDTETKKQVYLMNLVDDVTTLFGRNFTVASTENSAAVTRHLTVDKVSHQGAGEAGDFLIITVTTGYKDYTGYDGNAGYPLMKVLHEDLEVNGK